MSNSDEPVSIQQSNRDILDALSERPPGLIYHYTTQSGLLGIIKSQEIWATHFRHLNDTQEFVHAMTLLRERLKDPPGHSSVKEALQALENADFKNKINLYVASFSEVPDSLPQWRAYAGAAPGYAIGFNATDLKLPAQFHLARCVYNETGQQKRIEDLVKVLLNGLDAVTPGVDRTPYIKVDMALKLITYALTLKHPSFKDESEWRIFSESMMDDPPYEQKVFPGRIIDEPAPDNDETPLAFREGQSGIIPYRRVPLKNCHGGFPLEKIVVGPCPYPEQSCRSVRSLLVSRLGDWTRHAHGGIKVGASDIPYRNW